MHLQALYRSYSVKQRRPFLKCFLAVSLLYDLYCLIVPLEQDLLNRGLTTFFAGANLCLLGVSFKARRRFIWTTLPHLAWHAANLQILARMFLGQDLTPRDDLGWVLVIEYLIYVTLPLNLRYCLILAIGTFATYVVCLIGLMRSDGNLEYQIAANMIMLVGANLLGLTSSYLEDVQQKKAFLDTKQCLEMKLVIEEQSAEQERLLLSVLPEHVAVKMRQDLGSALDTQFKKIYMSRHENVSILYADIVGFTAISSTYSASELVKILNELFARFDRLSERYQQLRIKILGDCYYCISGAPRERPDHAVLCIHMGLSMVKAIKYVQQKTNSPVDMRVGIHTGAVLAGVLGQRQWQFDVYSKDVELANKMESSGLPGRVHISEKTLSFLDGEFEVEPAYGEKREESLRLAGLKTFFITKVNKPFKPESMKNGTVPEDAHEEDFNEEDLAGVITPVEDSTATAKEMTDTDDFRQRLRKDLMNRTGWKEINNHINKVTLQFRDPQKERNYRHDSESFSSVSLIGCPLSMFIIAAAQVLILPMDTLSLATCGITSWILAAIALFAISEGFPNLFPPSLVMASINTNNSVTGRLILSVACLMVLGVGNFVDTVSCTQIYNDPPVNCSGLHEIRTDCSYPSYFSHMCVLVLIASVLPIQPLYIAKSAIPFFTVILHTIANVFIMPDALIREDALSHRHCNSYTSSILALTLMMHMVMWGMNFLARYMEIGSRVLFLWKTEAEEQRERASDIRRRNEALVYNILPPHVAVHFLGNKKRQHEELYSQSYSEVGVLFASMPNFSDFYSEETVNNQGLECLRFLNEVISDFDALLEWDKFKDVIKIKTIGSTYMAASGLNPTGAPMEKDDSIQSRWSHLALLVEFAFELKKALQSINEQSFNHFVLKMGINHGPITAGVIGARKPHYDIWGNTVNVASRMESTGKAGYIQVTEETSEILSNFGYVFEQRGLVAVKGKGQLMTYYLVGKAGDAGVRAVKSDAKEPSLQIPTIVPNQQEEEEDEEINRNKDQKLEQHTDAEEAGEEAEPGDQVALLNEKNSD